MTVTQPRTVNTLIVEDEMLIAMNLTDMLENYKDTRGEAQRPDDPLIRFKVVATARTHTEAMKALHAAHARGETIEFMSLDHNLAGGSSGLDFLEEKDKLDDQPGHEWLRDMAVIVCSGKELPEALRQRRVGFVSKSVSMDEDYLSVAKDNVLRALRRRRKAEPAPPAPHKAAHTTSLQPLEIPAVRQQGRADTERESSFAWTRSLASAFGR
jgi:DNA-binding NarL/FixJ family response regulator